MPPASLHPGLDPERAREVEELRQEIAKIDAQLLAALDRRARLAREIGAVRAARPSEGAQLPHQDLAAVHALAARSSGDMPVENLRAIFREIFIASSQLELPATVCCLGPAGGFAHAAALARFGAAAGVSFADTVGAVMEEVVRKRADFAVVPLETKREGTLLQTVIALTTGELRIVGAIESGCSLSVMNRTGNLGDVETIYATSADRAACARFLATRPRASLLEVKSPAFACGAAREDHGVGALVVNEVGAAHGLVAAAQNVTDDPTDRVRYAVVGSRPSSRSGEDATAAVFAVRDAPGSLLEVLRQFSERGINVLKIHSHPAHLASGVPAGVGWSYLFFVEVVGHATDRSIVTAFEEVKRLSKFFKVLGSYPPPGSQPSAPRMTG